MAPPRTQPKFCRIAGCGDNTQARGLCASHYRRWHAADKPNIEQFIRDQPPGPVARRRKAARPAPPPEAPREDSKEPIAAPNPGGNSTACDDQFAPEPPPASKPADTQTFSVTSLTVTPAALIMRAPDAAGRLPLVKPINRIGAVPLSQDVDAIRVTLIAGNWLTLIDDTGRVLRQIELAHDEPTDEEEVADA